MIGKDTHSKGDQNAIRFGGKCAPLILLAFLVLFANATRLSIWQ